LTEGGQSGGEEDNKCNRKYEKGSAKRKRLGKNVYGKRAAEEVRNG